MIKWIILVILAVIAVTCPRMFGQTYWHWTPRANYHDSICKIRIGNEAGTGFLVSQNHVASAAHIGPRNAVGQRAALHFEGGETRLATIVLDDDQRDVMLCQLSSPINLAPFAIAVSSPGSGDYLEICGYGGPRDELRHFHTRAISPTLCSSCVISGDSGGPILNRNHEIVGIVSGGTNISPFMAEDNSRWNLVYPTSHSGIAPLRNFGRWIIPHGAISGIDRIRQERIAINQGNCIDGNCSPIQKPPVTTPPVTQPPVPVQPVSPPTAEIDYDKLADLIAAKMPKPKDGVDGQQGPPGPPGRDGVDANVDYDRLAREVESRLPPIYPMWIDAQGNVIDELPNGVRLGETLPLRIEILQRSKNPNFQQQ